MLIYDNTYVPTIAAVRPSSEYKRRPYKRKKSSSRSKISKREGRKKTVKRGGKLRKIKKKRGSKKFKGLKKKNSSLLKSLGLRVKKKY